MNDETSQLLSVFDCPNIPESTLVLAFSGWMDGGDVSTGTVQRLIDRVGAEPVGEIDPEPFYIYNIPGSMEISSLFRPHITIEEGLVSEVEMPSNTFYVDESHGVFFFVGKEPNLLWRTFGECIFKFARDAGVKRIMFVGSFGGAVPHTREPRLYVTCSNRKLLKEMAPYGVRRSGYEGPGSFTSYLMTEAEPRNLEMISLVAEIPGYLQGPNPSSMDAVSKRMTKILGMRVDMDELRTASTAWELQVTSAVEEDEELAEHIRDLEQQYDDALLEADIEDA